MTERYALTRGLGRFPGSPCGRVRYRPRTQWRRWRRSRRPRRGRYRRIVSWPCRSAPILLAARRYRPDPPRHEQDRIATIFSRPGTASKISPRQEQDRPRRFSTALRLTGMAVVIASNLRKELGGSAAVRRRLVQGRARRTSGTVRAERGRQDDAASHPGRARPSCTAANSPSRRAPASRSTTSGRRSTSTCRFATTCSAARPTSSRSSRSCAGSRPAMGEGAHDARRRCALLGGGRAARARRRLGLALAHDRRRPRARLHGRRPRSPARRRSRAAS